MTARVAVLVAAALVPASATAQTLTSGPEEPNAYVLPDPLVTNSGARVTTPDRWPARRQELLELFRANVYGRPLGAPTRVSWAVIKTDPAALGGAATGKQITIRVEKGAAQLTFPVVLFVPNARSRPAPVFLLINNRGANNTDPTRLEKSEFWPAEEVIARGYAIAAFQVNDVALDRGDDFQSGVHALLDPTGARPADAWGKVAAWAWAASRVIDYLVADPDLDPTRVAVVGHSRGGKAALWAGAQDTRPSLVIANESGCTGAKISRRRIGETVARINRLFPYWFARRYADFSDKESQLPVDQHTLIGLVAPRAVYVASAEQDANADPRGEYLGLHHAGVVYRLWGHQPLPHASPPVGQPVYSGPMGYHLRAGVHNLTLFDWQRFCDFADRVWGGNSGPKRRAGHPRGRRDGRAGQ